jgi:hypothetical protein
MCAPGSRFFDDAVDASDDPSGEGGVLDRRDPSNPFRDHTTVFIPSATGDVHWGDARVRYRSGSRRIAVEHRGFVNAMAAVRWAFCHVADPQSVLVSGCSAGSVGSAALVPYVIRRYPHARVAQLGDSLAFVFDGPIDLSDIRAYANMPRWIPAVRALRPGREHDGRLLRGDRAALPGRDVRPDQLLQRRSPARVLRRRGRRSGRL